MCGGDVLDKVAGGVDAPHALLAVARRRQALLAIPFIFAIGGVVAWAGSAASVEAFGRPLFALCAVFSFAVSGEPRLAR